MNFRVELFGKMRLWAENQVVGSVNSSRLQSLLAILVLNHDVPQGRGGLAFKLWPESSEDQARTNLRQLIHHLRRALPAECGNLVCDNHAACWHLREGTIDALDIEQALAEAVEKENSDDRKGAAKALLRALDIYKDDLLPDLYDDWINEPREHYRAQATEIMVRLVRLLEAEGNLEGAIRIGGKLLAFDILREPTYETLMRLHLRTGNPPAALRIYHQCLRILRRELGTTPGPMIDDLYEQALVEKEKPIEGPRANCLPGHAPPLIGRVRELKNARDSIRSGARFVLVSGEPGIGKSRFTEAIAESCGISVARAHCYSAQGRLAFGPVSELLRSEVFPPFLGRMAKTQLTELARVLPEILSKCSDIAPPQTIAEGWQRRHFYEALNSAVESGPMPLLLVIEDLHWCDAETFDWLGLFLHSKASERVSVLGTARLEEIDRSHPLNWLIRGLRREERLTEVELGPLDSDDVKALAAQVAGSRPASDFLKALPLATKGNPLFVVESVRASIEGGGGSIPPRLQAVIEGRLANLSPEAFELAELSAAIGTPFRGDLLALAADLEERDISKPLDELGRRRIFELSLDGNFNFTHELLREVAYSGMGAIRRRTCHRTLAQAMEKMHGSEGGPISGRIADHYQAAGMIARAIPHYRNAAHFARGRFAEKEAADLLRYALKLCGELPDGQERERLELELLSTLGPCLVATNGYSVPEVGNVYKRAFALSEKLADHEHRFAVLGGAWLFHIVKGDIPRASEIAFQCLEQVSAVGEPEIKQAANFLTGTSLFHLGRLSEAEVALRQALPDRGSLTHPALALFAGPDVGVFCRAYLSHLSWHMGQEELAQEHATASIELARNVGHPFSAAVALDYAAMLASFAGDAGRTMDLALEALDLCRRYGFVYYEAWAETLEGWAAVKLGEEGIERLRVGLAHLRELGAELRLPYYYALMAEGYSLSSRSPEAMAAVANGFAFAEKNGEAWALPHLHRTQNGLKVDHANL